MQGSGAFGRIGNTKSSASGIVIHRAKGVAAHVQSSAGRLDVLWAGKRIALRQIHRLLGSHTTLGGQANVGGRAFVSGVKAVQGFRS